MAKSAKATKGPAKASSKASSKTSNDEQQWRALESQYAAYKKPAEFKRLSNEVAAGVTEWRWANDEFRRNTPFFRELFKAPAVKWAPAAKGTVEHGLAADGSILVMRRRTGKTSDVWRHQFILRNPAGAAGAAGGAGGGGGYVEDTVTYEGRWPGGDVSRAPAKVELKSLSRSWFDAEGAGRRLLRELHVDAEGRSWYAYEYAGRRGGRLVSSSFDTVDAGKGFHARREYRYSYGSDGQLDQIDTEYFFLPEGERVERKTCYRRKKPK